MTQFFLVVSIICLIQSGVLVFKEYLFAGALGLITAAFTFYAFLISV